MEKECPHCSERVVAFVESAGGASCHPCGCGLSEGEYLVLKEAFLADDDRRFDDDDDDDDDEYGFGLGGDWWKEG